MYYDEDSRTFSFLAGLALGTALGAGLALLLAPQSGKRTRRQIMRTVSGARESVGSTWDDLAGDVRTVVKRGKRRLTL